jgi:hypothetical protein
VARGEVPPPPPSCHARIAPDPGLGVSFLLFRSAAAAETLQPQSAELTTTHTHVPPATTTATATATATTYHVYHVMAGGDGPDDGVARVGAEYYASRSLLLADGPTPCNIKYYIALAQLLASAATCYWLLANVSITDHDHPACARTRTYGHIWHVMSYISYIM